MIYIVSGYMRCGTSMMMKSLVAGGLEAAFSLDREKQMERLNSKWGDPDVPDGFKVNDEFLELDLVDYEALDFPLKYEGKLVKCLWRTLCWIKCRPMRLVMMRRPRQEVLQSCLAAFGAVPARVAGPFDEVMDLVVETLRDRRSFVSVHEVWYQDVLDEPLTVFRQLAWDGWPIDPYLAANVPQKKRKRFAA